MVGTLLLAHHASTRRTNGLHHFCCGDRNLMALPSLSLTILPSSLIGLMLYGGYPPTGSPRKHAAHQWVTPLLLWRSELDGFAVAVSHYTTIFTYWPDAVWWVPSYWLTTQARGAPMGYTTSAVEIGT